MSTSVIPVSLYRFVSHRRSRSRASVEGSQETYTIRSGEAARIASTAAPAQPARVIHSDRVVVQVEVGDGGGGAPAEARIRRAGRIRRPEKVAGARRPGQLDRGDSLRGGIRGRGGKGGERPHDRVRVDQAVIDRQRRVCVLPVKT